MKYAFLTAILMAAGAAAAAQPEQAQACSHLFTANGQGGSYIQYCVTDNGNISSIVTPAGAPQLGSVGEGYGLCQESPATEYHDYLSHVTPNWGAAQILSETGSTIKIGRSTADGNWTLVQTISKVTATGSIKILMALTNNQSVAKVAYLLRYANTFASPYTVRSAGASQNSAFAWDNTAGARNSGLQLLNAGKSPFAYRQAFVRLFGVPNACDFAGSTSPTGLLGTQLGTSMGLIYVYAGPVPAGATRTVTLNYRGL